METLSLGRRDVLRSADVFVAAEAARQRRLRRVAIILSLIAAPLIVRAVVGGIRYARGDLKGAASAFRWPLPHLPAGAGTYLPSILLILGLLAVLAVPLLAAGRSPHVLYRPEEIDVRLSDVRGAAVVVEEVVKTLNLFLAYRTFKERMGGTPRRAVLFEGPPGTGKTYIAKAMAAEAGVPFLFVSSSAFQSMYYGQTNRKIRSFFKALRSHARREGGAIGFIEEIDAIGATRAGMGAGSGREGISGVVNELLIQLQSFDQPPFWTRFSGLCIDLVNRWLPPGHRFHKPVAPPANILVIGATNRAGDLDPALVRPGRFDRTITIDLPGRLGRREIFDYYLARKAHLPDLDDPALRDQLAASTYGYSPVMIEHLLDEALVWALRRGAEKLSWDDIQKAKMTSELGLAQPVTYAEKERQTIATHEAGHATVAWLVAPERNLEVLSIIKRSSALGLLAHSEPEERWTKTKAEIEALIRVAMGGLVAEELFFGDTSSGVSGDLQAATEAAAQMVGSFGMSGSLISLDAVRTPGSPNIVAKVLADETSRERVDAILDAAREDVRVILSRYSYLVEALRDALLEREELIGDEINAVLEEAYVARDSDHGGNVVDLRDSLEGPDMPATQVASAGLVGPAGSVVSGREGDDSLLGEQAVSAESPVRPDPSATA
ncbi:MAG TPA: AAA family ATPase [Acidimicrobiales bacterium]|nr:AAA family ATPase [Acidimicrobiales bacterium]